MGTILLAIVAGVAIVASLVGIARWRARRPDTSAYGNDLSAYGADTDTSDGGGGGD